LAFTIHDSFTNCSVKDWSFHPWSICFSAPSKARKLRPQWWKKDLPAHSVPQRHAPTLVTEHQELYLSNWRLRDKIYYSQCTKRAWHWQRLKWCLSMAFVSPKTNI
jgi:hypothetical protein